MVERRGKSKTITPLSDSYHEKDIFIIDIKNNQKKKKNANLERRQSGGARGGQKKRKDLKKFHLFFNFRI